MANAAIVISNLADGKSAVASSQALTMPISNLFTPHPSERWRSLVNSAYFVFDKGAAISADTVMVGGLTCGANATIRVRCSTIDATGAAGDVYDSGVLATGTTNFDIRYPSTFVKRLAAPASYRYVRVDISDPDAAYVEAGAIVDGLSEAFTYNFTPGGSIQYVDRSRIGQTSSGLTLPWVDNTFRRADISFNWVTEAQRNGLIEDLDRVNGRHKNVLLITNPDSTSLPRATLFGLMTDITPVTYGPIFDLFGKQLRIEERI